MDTLTVNNKIAVSAKTNEARIKRMVCRNDHLDKLKEETKTRLLAELSPSSDKYKDVVKQLIVQGMIRLLEENVEIKCRKGEQDMINGFIAECQELYSARMMEETGREYSTNLVVLEDRFLNEEEGSEFGGVMLYAHGRRIVVANTLMDRMNLVFEMALPQIRAMLFPTPAKEQ